MIGVVLVLTIVVGSLSAVTATVVTDSSIDAYVQRLSEDVPFVSLSEVKPRPLPGTYEEALDRVQEVAAPATATVRGLTQDSDLIADWLRKDLDVGTGAVVTSDGWILFHQDVFATFDRPEQEAEIWVRDERYRIEQYVEDPLTDAVMVRVDARDLPSAAFGSTQDMDGGEITFALSPESGVFQTSLRSAAVYREDIVLPAEAFVASWQLTEAPESVMALYNSSAELVAVASAQNAIPMHHALGFVQATLRDQVASRPAIGAYVVDIGSVVNIDASLTQSMNEGALILPRNGRGNGVLVNGPADDAGLQTGDIILSIGGTSIGDGVSLAELIANQQIDASVSFTYLRDGEVAQGSIIPVDFEILRY